ncbi:MAG: hypothetical protein AB7F59_13160 [Bdellovibrionales bacterium]
MKILIILFFIQLLQANDGRLDPHGKGDVDIKNLNFLKEKACTTCHSSSGKLKIDAKHSCFNCHNRAPHSGVAEHLGKPYKGASISCLHCHSAHRFGSKKAEDSTFFKTTEKALPDHLVNKKKSESMLSKTCTDCHKW